MLQLIVNHRGKEYKGKKLEFDNVELFEENKEVLEEYIQKACMGHMEFLSTELENELDTLYLTKQTVMECTFIIKTTVG